jgi:hypothetical protein
MRLPVAVLVLAVAGSIAQSPAQNLPAVPHTPDVLGLYTSMPYQPARLQLQKHSTTVQVAPGADPGVSFNLHISDPKNLDMIDVYLTQPPNNSSVWMITRAWVYYPGAGGPPLALNTLVGALHDKYGKETMSSDHPVSLVLYWIYDQSGKLLTTAPAALQACDGGQYMSYISMGPPQTMNDQQKTCYASFFAVKATMNRSTDPQLLGSYNVQLVNLPYAYQAAMNTVAAKNGAEDKARQDQINRANQNKPTF